LCLLPEQVRYSGDVRPSANVVVADDMNGCTAEIAAHGGATGLSRVARRRTRPGAAPPAIDSGPASIGGTLSVDQAAVRLGRDRSRIYALIRSGDLVAVRSGERDELRLDASSLERWAVASSHRQARGRLLTPRNAWAIIGLASGDERLRERTLGLLERADDATRARSRWSRRSLLELAPGLRRRAAATVIHVPRVLLPAVQRDAGLVRTAVSVARAYGWRELRQRGPWALDAYARPEAVQALLRRIDELAAGEQAVDDTDTRTRPVLLRTVDGLWPFPAHTQLVPQPLAALDLLEYPDPVARRIGREVLRELSQTRTQTPPTVLARRNAKARALEGPRVGKLLRTASSRGPRPVVEGDPRTDTRAAAAHILGVLWASAGQGATVTELRAAIGITRERLEAAYEYVLEYPLLGLTVQSHADELRLVASGAVAASVERHLSAPRPVSLSRAALEVLSIVAYRQPLSQASIEAIRGTSSDSAIGTLLQRQLVALDAHRLFVTTPSFLNYLGLRDLADLPPLHDLAADDGLQDWAAIS